MQSWDKDGGGTLTLKEFLQSLRRLLVRGDDDDEGLQLWDESVRSAARECFDALAGDDRRLNKAEFEAWLSEGMKRAKDKRGAGGNFYRFW